MHLSLARIKRGLKGIAGSVLHGYPVRFDYAKKELIDLAFKEILPNAKSFADLGGVWGIDGAYTFYILDNFRIDGAYLVDTTITESVRTRSVRYKQLHLVEEDFGRITNPNGTEPLEVVLMFDVLLHQVKPNWDEVLRTYSAFTNCVVIYNQQFIASDRTVRLPDLGREAYFEHVPINGVGYENLFERPDEIHPQYGKPWRDVHNVWQWGITDRDLIATMDKLGYKTVHQKNHGQFSNFKNFENHAFVFLKAGA